MYSQTSLSQTKWDWWNLKIQDIRIFEIYQLKANIFKK